MRYMCTKAEEERRQCTCFGNEVVDVLGIEMELLLLHLKETKINNK